MACDLCNCPDHPNTPCAHCHNCIGHYTQTADYDEVHYDFDPKLTVHHTKPHYRYNAKTGEVREVSAIVREAFGL